MKIKRSGLLKLLASLALMSLPACSGALRHSSLPPLDLAAYQRELDAWRLGRIESLAGPDGWTTLAGLFWLEEGKSYRVGGDPANDIVLPGDHSPASLGSLTVGAGTVQFTAAAGAPVTHDGAPVETITLRSDRGGKPTVLAAGSVTLRVIDRAGKLAVRVKDSLHELRAGFKGLSYFPVDTALRVDAMLEPHESQRKLRVVNVVGQTDELASPGTLSFSIDGKPYRLEAAQEPGEGGLFIIFRDATSLDETYPAGRFIDAEAPDRAGHTIIDFNRAYNPPCAFTAFGTCPLPPPQNVLPIAIRAGEKRYEAPHR